MKIKFLTLSMITLLAISSISCSNDPDPIPTPIVAPTPVAADGFTWTINGGTTSRNSTITNAFIRTNSDLYILAKQPNDVDLFKIIVRGTTPGTYSLGIVNNFNYLEYTFSASESLKPIFSNSIISTTGSVTITSVANNKVSGYFTANGTGVGVTAISGTFTNIILE